MNRLAVVLIVSLALAEVFTCIQLIQARHQAGREFDRGWDAGFIRGLENPEYVDQESKQ